MSSGLRSFRNKQPPLLEGKPVVLERLILWHVQISLVRNDCVKHFPLCTKALSIWKRALKVGSKSSWLSTRPFWSNLLQIYYSLCVNALIENRVGLPRMDTLERSSTTHCTTALTLKAGREISPVSKNHPNTASRLSLNPCHQNLPA